MCYNMFGFFCARITLQIGNIAYNLELLLCILKDILK